MRLRLLLLAACSSSHVPPLTHTTPLTPTGELAERGHVIRTQSATAFYHEVAIGVNDRLELRLGTPGLPLPIMGGDLQLRASVLAPESRWRVVVGATATAEWATPSLWAGVTGTVAYRGDGWSAHATLRAAQRRFERGDELGLATAGVTWGSRTVVFADLGRVTYLDGRDWSEVPALACGVWFTAKHEARIGISAVVVDAGGQILPILPLLSVSEDYR